MKFSAVVATVLALATPALSTVYVTNPVSSTKASGGDSLEIKWQDSSASPKVSAWKGINIWLAAGSESSQFKLDQIASNLSTSKTHTQYKIPKNIGPAGQYYFIRFESTDVASNGTPSAMSFSARFNLNDVTGTFNSTVMAAAQGKEGSASMTGAATASASGAANASSTGLKTVASPSSSSNPAAAAKPSSASSQSAKSGAESLMVSFGAAAGVGALAAGVVALL